MDDSKVYRHTARAYTGAPNPRSPAARAAYKVMPPALLALADKAKLVGNSEATLQGALVRCEARPVMRAFTDGSAPTLQLTWYVDGARYNRTNVLLRFGVPR